MTIRDDRSMNYDLARGMVDGKVRFLRPDSANADESHASERAGALHTQHYGSMGVSAFNQSVVEDARPDYAVKEIRYNSGDGAIRQDIHATNIPPSFLQGA